MTKLHYRINEEAVKELFTLTGSAKRQYSLEVDWLGLSVEDRQLLVEVYGIHEEYNVSEMPNWRVGYTRSPMDGLHEYAAIFETVEDLMNTARQVLKEAVSTDNKAKCQWVMEQLNSHNQMIVHLHKWRAAVSKLSEEKQYEDYTNKLESLRKFSSDTKTYPEKVMSADGNNLSRALAGIVDVYRELLKDMQETREELYALFAVGEGIDTDIVYYNRRNEWIVEYGSDYLVSLVSEGYKYDEIYVKERMAKEYPGWHIHKGYQDDTVPTPEQMEMAAPYGARVYVDYRGKRFMLIEGYLGEHKIAKWL